MNLKKILPSLFLLPLAACHGIGEKGEAPPAQAERPNVLFISIDDLRPSLGVYGDTLAITPHMDRLADSSRVFLGAYSQQAVCGPSRASLLTGKLPDNIRVWHNRNLFRDTRPDIVTLPQLFKNNGYHTASMGKIFSGDPREEDPVSWSVPFILRQDGWRNYVNHSGRGKGPAFEAADVPDDGYPDGKVTNLAVAALKDYKENGTPFFLAVGFFKPHLPFNAPKRYWDLYDPAVFELERQPRRVQGAPDLAYRPHRELGGYSDVPANERVNPELARTLRHGYYACVSYIDAQVGRLMETLDELGLAENTIIVLWGDHGFALGEVSRWAKGTNFELDNRVPLMIRAPGMMKPGVPTEALVELVDIYPTLAGLANLPMPGDLDGTTLKPLLSDPSAPGREFALSQFARPGNPRTPEVMGYSIRNVTHRYTRWVNFSDKKTVAEELYDYTDGKSVARMDAFLIEHVNVVDQRAQADSLAQLRSAMDAQLAARSEVFAAQGKSARPDKGARAKRERGE
ncbi:MAG: sulfatase [Opitutales bacterium]|nr:sulfatase [Opitutales bacterium]